MEEHNGNRDGKSLAFGDRSWEYINARRQIFIVILHIDLSLDGSIVLIPPAR
jgi:hypothetical protein